MTRRASPGAAFGAIVCVGLAVGAEGGHAAAAGTLLLPPRGFAHAPVVIAFAPDPAIERFARRATAQATTPAARAAAIYTAIIALKKSGAIVGDRDNSPKARRPKTAAELFAATTRAGADRRAGCYELSALYVAAARAAGLEAVGMERIDPAGTGQTGHVMAGVRLSAAAPLSIFDLQNETRTSPVPVRELDDLELAAHHYNHLSVAAFLADDFATARRDIEIALSLAPENPSFLNNRATVLAAIGELPLAIAEATFAVTRAPRVPLYRYQLGRLLLAAGDLPGAMTALGHALQLRPRYGIARRDLGWARLLAGDPGGAAHELSRARRDDPATPEIDLYLGLLYLSADRDAEALVAARHGLERAPGDASLRALVALATGRPVMEGPVVERLRRALASVARAPATHEAGGAPSP